MRKVLNKMESACYGEGTPKQFVYFCAVLILAGYALTH